MKKFTFAIMTYNQENIVIETLESIKYQIEMYGEGILFKIIVTNDASKDKSDEIIRAWLEKNNTLFREGIIVYYNTKNQGTVFNYNHIMENIGDEPFKVIAGDDVIGPNNIFEELSFKRNIIDTFPYYRLENGVVKYRTDYLTDYFYRVKKWDCKKKKKLMRKGDLLHTPSTFYFKSLYVESKAKEFNSNFYLFEDDPTFYSMFNSVPDIDVCFHMKPLILYRYTESSTSTIPNAIFIQDWKKLQEFYLKDSKGFERLIIWLRLKTDFTKRISIYKIASRIACKRKFLVVYFLWHKEFVLFENNIRKGLEQMNNHYNTIKEKNEMFRKRVNYVSD